MTRKEKISQLNDIFAEINEDENAVCDLTSEDKIIEWKKDFKEYVNSLSMLNDDYKGIMEYIDELPVTSKPCDHAISRAEINKYCDGIISRDSRGNNDIVKAFKAFKVWVNSLSSVQPKYNANEWCKDCKEYDHDKHCCPRYNGVIRKAVEEIKQEHCKDAISRAEALKTINNMDIPEDMSVFEIKSHIGVEIGILPPVQPKSKTGHWIPVSERLPEIRQHVLCQCRGNNYLVLRLNHDGDWECIYPQTTYMQSFVIAWMPLPQAYEPQESEETYADGN